MERNYQEGHPYFSALVDSAMDAIISVDESRHITLFNPAAERMFGCPASEALGRPVEQFIPERFRAAHAQQVKLYGETGATNRRMGDLGYVYGLRKDGTEFPAEASISSVDVGGRKIFTVILRDISERRQAEADLRLLMTAVEQAEETILITDSKGFIVYANPAFEKTSGYKREEALGQHTRLLKSGKHPDEFYCQMWTTLASGETWAGRIVNKRKDGLFYEENASISPVRDAAGRVTHYVAAKRDVTQEVLLEEQIRRAQKMEAVGQLAGGVAHDFNNLLTIISGYSEIVLTKLPPNDPLRGSVKAISEAGGRAASLTRQLLAFSRQMVLEPKVLDLNAAVQETEKMLRRLIGEDVILTAVLDPGIKRVKADPGHLTQVMMNLCVNARDAMPQGGKLTIETGNVELNEDYARTRAEVRPGQYVMLAVSDTGSGMPPEVRARIFEPFFTTKGVGKGTGLGLAVVHGIVKQSGGHIAVYSEPGIGTSFKVYLPAVDEMASNREKAEAAEELSGTETILLVEDEDGVRALAVMSLQARGYDVLHARNGNEALKLAEQNAGAIDLLATDVVMPGMNGRELAAIMQKKWPKLKVLYMSGYTDDAIVRHGILQAEVAFLQKPYTPRALLVKIRQVLGQKKNA